MRADRRRADAGSTLVEALVALGLVAFAGLVVASAAAAGLRATHRAATLAPLTALAARELAALTMRAATATSTTTTLALAGFAEPLTCATEVARDDGLTTLAVEIAGGRPRASVRLTTRVVAAE